MTKAAAATLALASLVGSAEAFLSIGPGATTSGRAAPKAISAIRRPLAGRRKALPSLVRVAHGADGAATEEPVKKKFIKQERASIASGKNYLRGASVFKEVKKEVEEDMRVQFDSEMVAELKESNHVMERGGIQFHLAKDFGFCWGVERSINLAYSAIETFPDNQIHITNELIHNPTVNDRLHEKNVNFIKKIEGSTTNEKDFSDVSEGDVVMLPAFGATLDEMKMLEEKGVKVVDTTCPWVAKVWNTVHTHQVRGLTSVIHGKYAHEETMATKSMCETYICVKNLPEAEYLADYMLNGGDDVEFMKKFSAAASDHFDPKKHLKKIGLANQTTMYKKETRAIGQLLQKTIMSKYGPDKINEYYFEFDTICDATQTRQDAVSELCDWSAEQKDDTGLDFILVVGGWDSSNTAHLLEIPQMRGVRSFHINEADCITADNEITHRMVDGSIATDEFLPLGRGPGSLELKVGVTSGASTPDKAVQDALGRIIMLDQGMRAKVSGGATTTATATAMAMDSSDPKAKLRKLLLSL